MWKESSKSPADKEKQTSEAPKPQREKPKHGLVREILTTENEEQRNTIVANSLKKYLGSEWKEALITIDTESPVVKSRKEALAFLELWKSVGDGEAYPLKHLVRKWKNLKSQCVVLSLFTALGAESQQVCRQDTSYLIEKCTERGQDLWEHSTKEMKEMVRSIYNCEELYGTVCEMEVEEASLVLAQGLEKVPQLVALGLSKYQPRHEKLFLEAFSSVVEPCERSRVVLKRIFEKQHRLVLSSFSKLHAQGSVPLEELLEACIEGRLLPHIIRELEPAEFCLDVVLLAVSKEIVDLSMLLSIQTSEEFTNHFMQHVILRYGKGCSKGTNIYPLTVSTIISACSSLEMVSKVLPRSTQNYLSKLKSLLVPEIRSCLVKRVTLKQQAGEFLRNVISGQMTNSDAVVYMTQISSNKNAYDTELFEQIINEMEVKYSVIKRLSQHETMAMALFYGRMVKYEIVSPKRTKSMMQVVHGYLKEEVKTNRFKFALKVLETFCDVLEKYPFYCQEFSRMPQVYSANKSLYAYIRGHLAIQTVSSKDEAESGTQSFLEFVASVVGPVEAHPGWQKHFNMLTPSTISSVAEGVRKETQQRTEEELSKYLITKRMLKETNHLKLYADFVLEYSGTLFLRVREVLFRIMNAYGERHREIERIEKVTSLRIIGTYLGMFSLGDRMPVRKTEFKVKEFLIESVNRECIYSASVFVCKYVEECANSKILGKESPYVRSILRVLSEIHFLADGNDLLSLEIELCFTNIRSAVEEVLPDIGIQERRLGSKRKIQGLAKYVEIEKMRNILAHIAILAIDFAIREMTYSIVEKVTNICTRASVELAKRDFGTSREKGVQALRNMAGALSVSLACASTEGPIFSSAVNNIVHFTKLAGMEEAISAEKAAQLVEKNMKICLGVVEYITRKRVKQGFASVEEEFIEEIAEAGKDAGATKVPESYRVGLYEKAEYVKPEYIIAEEVTPVTVGEYHEICAYLSSINYKHRESGETIGPFTGSSAQKKWDEMQGVLQEIEKAGEEEAEQMFALDLLESIQVILSFVHSGTHEMACLFFCQNIIGSIFMLNNRWAQGECIKAVYKICRTSYSAMQEVSSWLIYAEDERKFNAEVIAQMIDKGIVNVAEYDMHLGSTLQKNPQRMKFVVDLLKRCILEEKPIGTPFDFVCTIEAVSKSVKGGTDEKIKVLLKEVARRIFLTKRETLDKEVFDNWTENLLYKVCGKERDACLGEVLRAVEERARDADSYREFLKTSFSVCIEFYLWLRKECSPVKYLKVEALGMLVGAVCKTKQTLVASLEILTEIFLDGVEAQYYQVQVLFTKLLVVVLESVEIECEDVVFEYLKKMRPSVLGVFMGGYVEVLFSEYVMRNMFLRNSIRGANILEWVYSALRVFPACAELDSAVYACAVFALQLKRFCPSFYLHYSSLFLMVIPISPQMVLLRNAWSLDRHPSSLEIIQQNKGKVANAKYYATLKRVQEGLSGKDGEVFGADVDEEMVSHVLVDGLTNQKETSKAYQDAIFRVFSKPEKLALKEQIVARLLERVCVVPPRALYVKKTLDVLLNSQTYMESLSEVVRKDKAILGKLIIHASTILATDTLK